MGRRATRRRRCRAGDRPRPSDRRSSAGRGRSSCRCRRTSSTSRSPPRAPIDSREPAAAPARAPRRSGRSSSCSPRAERPVILAGGGRPAGADVDRADRFAELLHVPVIAAWRRARRHLERPSALPRHGRLRAPRVGPRAPRREPTRCSCIGCRLNEATTYGYTIPAPGQRWAHVDLEPRAGRPGLPRRRLAVAADARAFLRAANERLLGGPSSTRSVVRARQANNAADRAAWEAATIVDDDAVGRPGRPPGPGRRDPAPGAAGRRDPHDRCRQLRRLGGPRLPVPPAGDIPRADVGRDGLRPAGGDRGGARPPRSGGGRPGRRRRVRDDDGRARDGGSRAGAGRSSSSSTTSATARSGCTRSARHGRRASRRSSDRSTSRRSRGPAARGHAGRDGRRFEPALRQALAADRPTVIQLDARPRAGCRSDEHP